MFKVFLLFLVLHHVVSEEPEPMFRAKGNTIEMGYCFGADYIVVYRSTPEGDQLLSNSSNSNLPNTPPADLQGRTSISEEQNLLGLQIENLTHLDTGIYRRECWENNTLASNHTQHLTVCNEESESEEIVLKEEGWAEIRCNSTFIGHEGISLLWYFEIFPTYRPTLFLNTSVSLDPLVKDMPGVMEIRDSGSLLILDKSVFMDNQQFYCLVIQDKKCLSFQNMYPQDNSESRDIYVSLGDRVILQCPAYGKNQHWETPMGTVKDSHTILDDQMSLLAGDDSEDFSLVITNISDEHSGPYSCISSSLEKEYILTICPKSDSRELSVHVGENIQLRCGFGLNISGRVQWYRREPSGQHELIFDSDDETAPIPQDLIHRMHSFQNGSVLEISDSEKNDGGMYRCVVLSRNEFLESTYDDEDYTEETEPEDELGDDNGWYDAPKCVFKKDIFLSFSMEMGVVAGIVVGLLLLLVVGVTVAVIVIRYMRTKASQEQRRAAPGEQERMNMDPGCTESLTTGEAGD